MKDDELRIKVGDLVYATFTGQINDLRGEVVYMPQATGDSWIIKEQWQHNSPSNGTIHYVQTFAMISKLVTEEKK